MQRREAKGKRWVFAVTAGCSSRVPKSATGAGATQIGGDSAMRASAIEQKPRCLEVGKAAAAKQRRKRGRCRGGGWVEGERSVNGWWRWTKLLRKERKKRGRRDGKSTTSNGHNPFLTPRPHAAMLPLSKPNARLTTQNAPNQRPARRGAVHTCNMRRRIAAALRDRSGLTRCYRFSTPIRECATQL